jgi:diguanylate cyclase
MPTENNQKTSPQQSAEYMRLALSKLSEFKLPLSAKNLALLFTYASGANAHLNSVIDDALKQSGQLDEGTTEKLFATYVCGCEPMQDEKLQSELLNAVAQVLGSIVDFAGHAALSDKTLEHHLQTLASTRDPADVLRIAAEIISDTRSLVEASRSLEETMRQSTVEIEGLREELDYAREQATRDTLTGLHNRRGFDKEIAQALQNFEQEGEGFCLMMLDVDHFKKVNDTHGHLVGDKVLIGISNLLVKQMRGSDYLARFGGEEFAILLYGNQLASAFTVAENLRSSVERLKLKHIKSGKTLDPINVSLGVACCRSGESEVDLIQRCDKALYRAKELGRNRTVIAD